MTTIYTININNKIMRYLLKNCNIKKLGDKLSGSMPDAKILITDDNNKIYFDYKGKDNIK